MVADFRISGEADVYFESLKSNTYISCMDTAYVRESSPPFQQPYKIQYLHCSYLNSLVIFEFCCIFTPTARS